MSLRLGIEDTDQVANQLADLTPEQRALLTMRLRKKAVEKTEQGNLNPGIKPILREGPIPLSYAQQGLWFLQQLEPESAAYNIRLAVRLTGSLNLHALEASLSEIARRHESLRTTFEVIDAQPVQLIHQPQAVTLTVSDLSQLSEMEREEETERQARLEAQAAFNLSACPLWRARVLRLSEQEHVFVLTMHHIISDGWSMGILFRELSVLYSCYAQGKESPLQDLAIQYADYAQWQREWLQGQRLAEQLQYWEEQLRGAPGMLELPSDRPRPAVQSYRGKRHRVELPVELTRQLKQFSTEQGVTLFMTLLAAFQLLLSRYAGQEDVVVGTPVAGRNRTEVEGLIGFFLNTLALRADVSGNPTFRELVGRVKQVCLGAYAHQEVPFERLVDEMQIERNLSYSPLVQVMFNLRNLEEEHFSLPGLQSAPLGNPDPEAKFSLVLNASENRERLVFNFIFNTDLFDPSTIERMSAHFRRLLTGIVTEADRPVSELTHLPSDERQRVLTEWNDTTIDYAADLCIHEIFEQQVERTPDAVALVYESETLSYRELNERANELAHYLQEQGISPESLVAVLLERSTWMVVSLLGVLKAGGAYLPLDPALPVERLRLMLEDSGARMLLTSRELSNSLFTTQEEQPFKLVHLDAQCRQIEQYSSEKLPCRASAQNLAYVIYTSGSTGQPKAAMNTHGAIRNRLLWMQQAYCLTADDCVLQKTPYSFDVSVWEFFWPLMYGAKLAVARPGGHQDSEYLMQLIEAQQITTLHFVPSMLSVFLQHGDFKRCRSVRQVMCSGEALSQEIVERFFQKLGWAELHNLYGPTEAAVDVSFWNCSSEQHARGVVPIGRPIANTQLYILDARLEPVGIGIPGELYIGGEGVGRGYWRRPDLTAERFIPDTYTAVGGARLYRTGDRARYLPDGNIEFLGRVDYQVKLRGHRIELGEIEAVLRQHASVRDAVVKLWDDGEDGPRLIAYVVMSEGQSEDLTGVALRDYLKERLPDYMLPSTFMVLESMPLTPNGKVDRKRLPQPTQSDALTGTRFEAPATPLQAMLAELWRESLKLEQVSIHANFFEAGGDSLKGAVLINKLQQRLGEVVYVVAIFDAPTIAALASYLERKYPEAVAKVCGTASSGIVPAKACGITAADVGRLRETMARHRRSGTNSPAAQKNPSAVFILSPPRSGSTLLRVMLGGSANLFAPPELELLAFDTMSERRAAFSGRNTFSLEGTIRAVMQLRSCDAQTARELIQRYEDGHVRVQEFYRQLQEWCGDRRLADKTPAYALELETLRRAEDYFADPFYLHLLRHPTAVINSFVEARLDEVFFRYEHNCTPRGLAELIWIISHQNIQEFLSEIPAERQTQVKFEELVKQPKAVAQRLSQLLGVEFSQEMLEPYRESQKRMTDGIHEVSRMHGDMKFFTHSAIDPKVADRWRERPESLPLGEVTLELASSFGYLPAEETNDTAQAGKSTAINALPRDEHAGLKLSFAQQRLWFLDQLQPGSAIYNIPSARRLKGRLDIGALERSLTEIVRRHESLRTTFSVAGEMPVQVVSEPQPVRLAVTDLSHVPAARREAEARREASEEARQPFNLAQGPLLRTRLLKLGADDHVLLLTMHHIISDGLSVGILLHELNVLYNAFTAGQPSPLEHLPIQYADYARWQRDYLQTEVLDEQLHYWKEQLRGIPTLLELPTDHSRPSVQTFKGATQRFALPDKLTQQLKELSRHEGVTLFMTLLAAFHVLLSRYTGQHDIVVGSPISGRTRAETEGMIGLFVNTLALRADVSGNPTFHELLRQVREVCLGAYAHQDIPFERLVEELQPNRSLSHQPLFQVFFQLNTAPESLSLTDLNSTAFKHQTETAKFDLTLALSETAMGLRGSLEYNTDLFDPSTASRMVSHFQRVIEFAVADSHRPIAQLSLLSETEREQLLIEWNETARDFGASPDVIALFEQQAERSPQALAVICDEQTLSYQELNERANQLAHYLLHQGITAEAVVGILMERSVEMLIAVLGVLKAGAAYLPLDAAYPPERLRFMVEDAEVQLLLTQRSVGARIGELRVKRLCLDRECETLQEQSRENPLARVSGENLAYLIYTSGSTGTPKGVGVRRSALNNFLRTMMERPGLRSEDVLAAVTTLSFDIAALELLLPLIVGARVLLISRAVSADAVQLSRSLAEMKVSVMQATPATWRMLIESGWRAGAEFKALCGGEALSQELATKLLERVGELWNMYGPTETTIWSTIERVESGQTVSIGRAIANTQVYVLNDELQPVPVGVRGELYIGGEGLARGYLNNPELTAERFLPDAFSGLEGARLYRSGDVVRWREEASLEYVGRADTQVKVRGHRIELGEVQSVLEEHESVRECVVARAENQLVAYVVFHSGAEKPVAAELRQHVRARLPEYMVPNLVVELEQMPLTANGKVDRKRLPAPEYDQLNLENSYVGAQTPLEEAVSVIWQEALQIERVGRHDNFFELGGHSLLAIRVVARVKESLRVELPLHYLFEHPTVAGLSEKIRSLAQDEAEDGQTTNDGDETNKYAALSYAQERLWFLNQLEPENPGFNLHVAVHFDGELDRNALEASLNEVVKRHEALRTTFAEKGGQLVQIIRAKLTLSLNQFNLEHLSEEEAKAEQSRLINEELEHPFNLSESPLLRSILLKFSNHEHLLLLKLHHIISDQPSLDLLVSQLMAIYDASVAGRRAELPVLPLQYADYARWQRDRLQETVLAGQLQYWTEQLSSVPTLLELPADHPRPAIQSYRGASESFELTPELSRSLRELSQREGVTLFMSLLAVFQLLLAKYSGQSEIVVGSPVAGRTRAETEDLIGLFVNTLALRVDISGNPTFQELVGRVKKVCLEAYAHQEIPFEKLVEQLQPERSLSHQPLFQVLFQLQGARPEGDSTLRWHSFTQPSHISEFDLSLTMSETTAGLSGSIEYSTDLFEGTTVRRLLERFTALLEAVATEPGQRVERISLLTEAEREQLLYGLNNTATECPRDTCIHHLFEDQVARTPDAIALIFEQEQLTYRELDERANRLAHYLQQQGIGPESVVAILLERSVEMVISLLATLKAGATYLPLDTAYPRERLQLMLEDSSAQVLLTQDELSSPFAQTKCRTICLDAGRERIAEHSGGPVPSEVAAENLAYVIYTSGSTGRPKGVAIAHRSAVMMLRWATDTFQPRHFAGALFSTSICFDLSVFELFAPLCCGGAVILAANALQLPSLPAAQRVTLVNTVPSAMSELVRSQELPDSVLVVNLAGEALSRQLVEAVYALPHVEQVWNLYGPTEDTTYSTAALVERGCDSAPAIGKPLHGGRAFVLDSRMELVAMGLVGELYLGGEGLARGYLGRPDLTGERFVPHPWSDEEGERLYRTGDLARWRPNGELEYLGRCDQQVKVRGFRIELGEVETTLAGHESVREAVVLALGEGSAARLVAYVVAEERATLNSTELRGYLRERLPEYMVPSLIVELERMPLTANGKVDRKRLPAPDYNHLDLGHAYLAPRTPTEEMLASLCCELLGIERVGVHDNFFELGGHSLLVTQLVSQVRRVFKIEVALRTIFERPTVAGMAEHVDEARASQQGLQAPPIVPVSRDQQLPASFAQQRLWFLDQLEPGNTSFNLRKAIRLKGELNVAALEQSLSEIVRRHESLRTSFAMVDGQPMQVFSPVVTFNLPLYDLSALPSAERREEEAQLLAQQEAQTPFDLAQGPMIRGRLLRLEEKEHILVIALHHVVADGWSMGVLYRELCALYRAFAVGQPSPLAELPVQYADFAVWQREWLRGEVLEEQLGYWSRQVGGAAVLNLPADIPRPATQTYSGAVKSFVLPRPLLDALKEVCQREGVTLYMLVLAAFQVLLSRYSGQQDLTVGSPVANRNRIEVEGLLGFFVNTLPMRTDLSGDPTCRELLKRVRETALGAYAHQDVPYEDTVKKVQPERKLSYNPLYQVMLVLQNAPMEQLQMPGLELVPLAIEGEMVKLDEALSLEAHRGARGSDLAEEFGTSDVSYSRTVGQQLDLMMSVREMQIGLCGTLRYNADVFYPATITRMLQHFETLLGNFASDVNQRISQLSLLTDAEREEVIKGWNQTGRIYSKDKLVHQLIEQQAEQRPHALAIVGEEAALSYRELNERANQLAHYLIEQGVGAEAVVGILLERSIEMIVSVLAVLKSGAAYLPLDAAYPAERLRFMIEDAHVEMLLTQESLLERVGEFTVKSLCLGRDSAILKEHSCENPDTAVNGENLAYVIYTSGSTGVPKGVLLRHSSLLNFVSAATEHYQLRDTDRVLQFASLSFDTSSEEIYTCLASGATLVLRSDGMLSSGAEFLRACEEQGIKVLDLPTAYWHELTAEMEREGLEAGGQLRLVIIGGEKAQAGALLKWRNRVSDSVRLVNTYGPTEATIVSTSCDVQVAVPIDGELFEVPLGRPLPNVEVYVLDKHMQPVPVGVAGELYIGGEGVARGYLNQPSPTAERFVPDPFSGARGARLYRTGDCVCYRGDGSLQYLARVDNQVKIRGFRIEPGEIETVLRQSEHVRDAVVVVNTDDEDEKRLVAYVLGGGDSRPSTSELRSFVKERLPHYMIPSAFVVLDKWPLTSSGKVDRRALPSPESFQPEMDKAYQAPRTAVEEVLCGIWGEVLRVEQVGIDDNFFELGGHSLLATRLLSRVRAAFEVRLPLRSIFEAPTVLGMANSLFIAAGERDSIEKTAQVLIQLSQLSEEEAAALLSLQLSE